MTASSPSSARTFPARRAILADVRRFVASCADRDGFSEHRDALLLSVSEACANAILHSDAREVTVAWSALPDRVEITVRDDGTFRRRLPRPELDKDGHRGIPLMMALLDQVRISGGTTARPGTTVQLTKYRDTGAQRAHG